MSDFLNKTGVPNIENTIFRRLQNRYNHLAAQANGTTIPSNSLTDSLYVIKNGSDVSELFFNGQQLTQGGEISSSIWEVDGTDSTQVITLNSKNVSLKSLDLKDIGFGIFTDKAATTTDKKLYTYNDGGTTKLYFGDVQLDSSHTAALWTTSGSNLLPNGDYGINMEVASVRHSITNVLNLTAETIAMIGSTRTISNIAGISFTALSPYITGLKTLTFSTGSSIASLETLTCVNNNLTNTTIDNIFGGKNDGVRDYTEIADGDYLLAPEIQVNNSGGDAKMYANEYRIGTTASYQSLANYIKSEYNTNLGTLTGISVTAGIGGSPFGYLTSAIVPAQNIAGYTAYNGIKADVIVCDEFLKADKIVCNSLYSNAGGTGGDLLDFLSGTGSAIGGIGSTIAGASNLVAGGMVLGGGIAAGTGLIAIAVTPNGNFYGNQHAFNWEETEWDGAAGELGMTSPFVTFGTRANAPTERKQMASFGINPRSGRITIATWGATEDARTLSGQNDVQWCDSGYINSHDQQYSIAFKSYSSSTDYDNTAKYAPTCTYDGGNLVSVGYSNRLMNLNGRLYFNSSSNKLAYTSEITSTTYWELNGGFLQPNATSGFTGVIQLNADVCNLYADVYLSTGHQLNFIQSSKAHIKYNDTAKTLTFQNGDGTGEFIFNNYLGVAQFRIDTANNRLELPTGGFFFQESGDQKIRKAGSGVLQISSVEDTTFLVSANENKIITLNKPTSVWSAGYEYPVMTLKDERTAVSDDAVRTSTQMEMVSPNGTGQMYLRVDNGVNADYTNVFYSRRQGTTLGNEYNYFFDTPKTKVNSLQFTDMGLSVINTGLEFTTSPGINVLSWYGDYVLTDNAPNIENRITFNDITLTNSGLERNGSNIYWDGSKLNSQSGSAYFTDDSTTATSVALDFTFAQDVFVTDQFSTGHINSRINLTTSSANEISQITMCNLKRFIEYNTTAAQERLYIDYACGTDANDNISIRMGSTPATYLKIIPASTTIYNDLIIDTGENLTLTQGNITLTQGDITATAGNINITAGNATLTSGNITLSSGDLTIVGDIDCNGTWKIRSSNIATNVCNTLMGDTSLAFSLAGGSNPDAYYFKDYNAANICKIKTNDFSFYGSDTNSKFQITSSEINCYNDIKLPSANIYLQQGDTSTTDDSNFIQLGKWRIQQKIVPAVEYQALKFIWTADTSKGAYILRSRTDGALFTGIHRNSVKKPNPQFVLKQGMILISTGQIRNYDKPDIITIDQTLPLLTPSSKPRDKAVFGIYAGQKELVDLYINGNIGTEMTPLIPDDRRALINGSGEGAVLVCNEGGNIEVGDLIVSSSKLGIGMKQNDDLIRSYSCAKATTAHIFKDKNEEVLIGCIYLM